MKIVIVGNGKLGYSLAEQLTEEGHDVVIIDSSENVIRVTRNALDVSCIFGNGNNQDIQVQAGVPNADLVIAVTSTDEQNILCCLLAKKLGAKHTIARVREPDYAKSVMTLREELNLSLAINPEREAATDISRILRFPSAMKVDFFAKGRLEMVELKLPADSPIIGHPLSKISGLFKVRILICAVQRGDEVIIPNGDFVPQEGDRISLTAAPTDISQLFRALGLTSTKTRTAMIVGGGKIAYYLIRELLEAGIRVKVLDRDEKRCELLAERYPKATVLCGDGTDRETLKEEGAEDVDALVALTGLDEENVVISMYAGACNVPKVITKVNHISFGEVLSKAGIECVITPHTIAADRIVRYVRAMQSSSGGSMLALSKIVGGKVEAIEFKVNEEFKGKEQPLKKLKLKKNLLIVSIVRDGKILYPTGDDVIRTNDRVIVVTTDKGMDELNDIFA